MDPGTALGAVSLGIEVLKGIKTYFSGYRAYATEIEQIRQQLEQLESILKPLDTSDHGIQAALNSCKDGFVQLRAKLQKLQTYSVPQCLRQRLKSQVQRLAFPLLRQDLIELQNHVAGLLKILSLAVQVDDHNLSLKTHQAVLSGHDLQHKSLALQEEMARLRETRDFREAMEWLDAPAEQLAHIKTKRAIGTCGWVTDTKTYKNWDRVLWLTGAAGSGKTYLSSAIIDHAGALYHHCTFADTKSLSLAGILASLASQLSYPAPVLAAYRAHHAQKPSLDILKSLVDGVCVPIVIDGLDEIPNKDERSAVIDYFANHKVCVTSRDLVDIRLELEAVGAAIIVVEESENRGDIEKYIDKQIEKWPADITLSVEAKAMIKRVMNHKAQGSFRWVFCQMEELRKLPTTNLEYVKEVLDDLPATLYSTYQRALQGIDQRLRQEAVNALRALLVSQSVHVLHLVELCAIRLQKDGFRYGTVELGKRLAAQEVIACLGSLVSVHHGYSVSWTGKCEDRCLRLAHFSVREYLTSGNMQGTDLDRFSMDDRLSRHLLAQSYLCYLIHFIQSSVSLRGRELIQRDWYCDSVRSHPMAEYALHRWRSLLLEDQDLVPKYHEDICTVDSLRRPFHMPGTVKDFRYGTRMKPSGPDLPSDLEIARMRPYHFRLRMLVTIPMVNDAISMAIVFNLPLLVQKLLVDKPEASTTSYIDDWLQLAIMTGNYRTLEVLLAHGTNNRSGGVLRAAVIMGSDKKQVSCKLVRRLISDGFCVNHRDPLDDCTILGFACFAQQVDHVRMMLQRGAEPVYKGFDALYYSTVAVMEDIGTVHRWKLDSVGRPLRILQLLLGAQTWPSEAMRQESISQILSSEGSGGWQSELERRAIRNQAREKDDPDDDFDWYTPAMRAEELELAKALLAEQRAIIALLQQARTSNGVEL